METSRLIAFILAELLVYVYAVRTGTEVTFLKFPRPSVVKGTGRKVCFEYAYSMNANTHTHVGFYGLRGLSIGVMFFILYKLYVLFPYT